MSDQNNETPRYVLGGADPLVKDPDDHQEKSGGFPWGIIWKSMAALTVLGLVVAVAGAIYAFNYMNSLKPDLPDYTVLEEYQPAVTTRVHAGDGTLVAEFARERRLFVPIETIPDSVKQAFISAEDKNFYEHHGLDYRGIIRAGRNNIIDKLRGRSGPMEGASTITQQVAKNFLLTSDQKFERKAKEALIAMRMEKAFTKDHILELYLNEIYLGNRSYGVAAAALNYFGKPLTELEPNEAAYLAVLPKAPSNYHPIRNHDRALARRNWILNRMFEDGFLSEEQLATEQAKPLNAQIAPPLGARSSDSRYFAEEVRRQIAVLYGVEALYDGGLSVRTTLDPKLQEVAQFAFRKWLAEYDRRHGWRGALANIPLPSDLNARVDSDSRGEEEPPYVWQDALQAQMRTLYDERKASDDLEPWIPALVLGVEDERAQVGLIDGRTVIVPLAQMEWAREYGDADHMGPEITTAKQVLGTGDVIYVEELGGEENKTFALRQIPAVNGAFVAIDPHTGRVLAMVGGFSFGMNEYNRATQAWRQPGSTFKPFVYAAALDAGYTPSSIVLDAPFVAPGLNGEWWKPGNYVQGRFYGESTLRLGIEKSRNTMTARLAQDIGIGRIIDYAERFGVSETLPRELAISLGAGETTLMRLTTAYAQFVNGGKRIEPFVIDRVQDRSGDTIYARDDRMCYDCNVDEWDEQSEPRLADERENVIDARTAYQMVSILEGVIDRGTGSKINQLADPSLPLAGKTGTTDDYRDAWFVGFSPDLAAGVYVGFDTPSTLGGGEGGGNVAAPIFGEFMGRVLPGRDVVPFRAPSGIRLVRVNSKTGKPTTPGDPNVILEAFKAEDDIYGSNRFSTDASPSNAGRGDEGIADDLGGIY
ncbi:penicillin-binding protein 1A [Parvularcula sp. LCG005]|uniref:penicillin-binding protein 1A n=1 Tax=Parvularcula sp. LCG005 TaxID=3078805 RepID=UPI00294292DC|nr:penicillin-binding protein 1A [Parvularcula sp. LCG005]WOI52025.1 penicillin-binding protein 1A [Parvularcula sp. LCG005]